MSAIDNIVSPFAGRYGTAEAIALAVVWLTFAISAFVFSEPAPYDALMCGLILMLPLVRLTEFTLLIVVLFLLWLVVLVGAYISTPVADIIGDAIKHSTVTLYLVLSAAVLAAFIAHRPIEHSRVILAGYTAAAVLATTAAIVGYFQLAPGAYDMFTRAGRARATFEDPNVYGPFMVPVLLWLAHRILHGGIRQNLVLGAVISYLLLGILLAFSRGAWLNTVVAFFVFGLLSFITTRSSRHRTRLVLLASGGALLSVVLIVVALNWSATADLLRERASLEQSYDIGREGRFAGQRKAVGVILEHPLGVGPLSYSPRYHHEDAHNVYLTAFLDYGWIGGFGFLVIVVTTLVVGLQSALRHAPFQELSIIAFAAFFALSVEGLIVDTYHWRHFYVVMGLIWGFQVAGLKLRRRFNDKSSRAKRAGLPPLSSRSNPARPAATAAAVPPAGHSR